MIDYVDYVNKERKDEFHSSVVTTSLKKDILGTRALVPYTGLIFVEPQKAFFFSFCKDYEALEMRFRTLGIDIFINVEVETRL